jgi:hypothetical protein
VRRYPTGNVVNTEAEDIVGSRYQATTGEDKADGEDIVCAVVNCKVFELAMALSLFVATSWPIKSNYQFKPHVESQIS